MSKKIKKILAKKNKKKIVSLTAYSKNIAKILDKYCDIILVGDSMANVLYGMKNTNKITIDKSNHFLLSDTVGFIRNLPDNLIASFRSTLSEIIDSNLL